MSPSQVYLWEGTAQIREMHVAEGKSKFTLTYEYETFSNVVVCINKTENNYSKHACREFASYTWAFAASLWHILINRIDIYTFGI